MLKVSAFYLEKQKSVIPKKIFFLSRTAKIDPKDGVSHLNFPEGFGKNSFIALLRLTKHLIPDFDGLKKIRSNK